MEEGSRRGNGNHGLPAFVVLGLAMRKEQRNGRKKLAILEALYSFYPAS